MVIRRALRLLDVKHVAVTVNCVPPAHSQAILAGPPRTEKSLFGYFRSRQFRQPQRSRSGDPGPKIQISWPFGQFKRREI